MPFFLLIVAVVMFSCVFLNIISSRLGIPILLAFILLGMFFGSDGIVKITFEDYGFAEQICSVALIFIMFYGGFGTNWHEARPIAARSLMLSGLGVIMTSGLVGIFCRFALGTDWLEGLLIGAVVGSTDAASVFSILRSKRLNLKYNTASLLELESGSNDPFSYMLTAIILASMNGTATGVGIAYTVFAQLVFGVAAGVIIAPVSSFFLKRIKSLSAGFNEIFVIAVAILSYAVPAAFGGNGYLSAYIVGIVLGNTEVGSKKTLVPFFDGITGLMQMLIFFILGLLSFPSKLPAVLSTAIPIALFLTFVARPLSVFAILTPFGSKPNQQLLVSWAGLRGAASIVFAVMAVMSVRTENDIFHIVFCIVLLSIFFQGSLLPIVSKRLGMIDANSNVLKTFSDYSEEVSIRFIQVRLDEKHCWCGSSIKEIILPPDTLIVMIIRGEEKIVPNGATVLKAQDALILSAKSPEKITGVNLTEKVVRADDDYKDMKIMDIKNENRSLIIMIMRGDEIIVPNGNTVICENDMLVINHRDE